MINNEFIRNLSAKAAQVFPAAGAVQQDVEKRLYELLQTTFARLNLVSREEFEAQRAVLARATETVRELEQKLAQLEAQIDARERGAGEVGQQHPS